MRDYHDEPTTAKLDELVVALDLVREALGALRRPPARVVHGVDPDQPVGAIARELRFRLGQRRYRYLMTKMAGIDRDDRLEGCAARRVNGNGHADHAGMEG